MIRSFLGSMTARIFLTLVLGTIGSGSLVMTLAANERARLDTHIRMHHAAERMEQLILTLDGVPPSSRAAVIQVAQRYAVRVALNASAPVPGKASDSEFAMELRRTLGENRHIGVYDGKDRDCATEGTSQDAAPAAGHRCEIIAASLQDGSPVRLDIRRPDRTPPPFMKNFLSDLVLLLTALVVLALIVAHMATKPLRRLARAAHELGRDIERQPLPETEGSTEVREASAAFNRMQARIRDHLQQRTCMLAAIAHDLQTPLTRLRLRLEKVGDPDLRGKLIKDMTDTQKMAREGLEFARTLNVDEPFEFVDLDSLVAAISNDAIDAGCDVTCSGSIGAPVLAAPQALRRCIANLIENAIKYGKLARVTVNRVDRTALVSVADAGPGIPDGRLEEVFQPFNRGGGAHPEVAAGTGLGLAIARIVAEKHRGVVRLRNGAPDEGGLVATLELPLP